MTDATIKLNHKTPTNVDFDLSIEGLGKDGVEPVVRLVLCGLDGMCSMYPCSKKSDNAWTVRIPSCEQFNQDSIPFDIEVVIDGYYFKPASGEAILVKAPAIALKAKRTTNSKVTESQITGQYAPRNQLLSPEFEPPQGSVKTAQAEKDDQQIDLDRLSTIASNVVPGESTDPTPDVSLTDDYNPKQIASDIIKRAIGNIPRPTTKGRLFGRTEDDRVYVPGLMGASGTRRQSTQKAKNTLKK